MEPELNQRLATLEQKVDAMAAIVEKLRKYFLWTGIITVVLFILPLLGLLFVIPSFLKSYTQMDNLDPASGHTSQVDTLNSLLK